MKFSNLLLLLLLIPSPLHSQTTRVTLDLHDGRGPLPYVLETPPPPIVVLKEQPAVGLNHDTPVTYSPQDAFIDCIKNAGFGSWEKPYDGNPGPQDVNGWPIGNRWGIKVWVERKPEDVTGIYKLIIEGKTNVTLSASGQTRLVNLRYDSTTNQTLADLDVKHGTLYLRFADGDENLRVQLLRPGHETGAAIFTDRFKELVRKTGVQRFMDWNHTNNSLVTDFSQRARVTDANFWRGVPIEYQIALCNETETDFYYNEPFLAGEEFSRQAAALINASLAPPLRFYVEKSNEVWNGIFKQNKQNRDEATARAIAKDPKITVNGTETRQGYWEIYNYADRTVQLKRLYGPRAQVVLGGHFGFGRNVQGPGYWTRKQLEWVQQFYGNPKDYVHILGVAPYYKLSPQATTQPITPEQYIQSVAASTVTNDSHFLGWVALADSYQLELFAYEGGSEEKKPAGGASILVAQTMPEFEEPNFQYLDNFFRNGGDRFIWFVGIARNNHENTFGATDTLRNLQTPKLKAVERAGQKYRYK